MTNKLLLAAIAFGLWANAATSLVRPVQAQTDQLASEVRRIAEELRQLVENGDQCLNPKLCQR
jgi:outer membrane murein-binding lipoprotein Lpp